MTALHLPKTLVLVGLMGCGKSSIGKRLAAHLGLPFRDADAEIEAAAGMTIAEIFEKHGEPAFRDGERRVIARLLAEPVHILATGGGAFMDPETRARIKRDALSLWLRVDLEELVRRTAKRSHRPLLNQGNPREVLQRLMDVRYPVYAEADMVVDGDASDHDTMVGRVIDTIQAHLAAINQGKSAS